MTNIKERIQREVSLNFLWQIAIRIRRQYTYIYISQYIYIYIHTQDTQLTSNRIDTRNYFNEAHFFSFWDSSKRGEVKLTTCISPQYGLAKDHTRHQARVRHFKKGWQHHTDPNAFSTGFGRAGTGLKGKRILEPTHPTLARSFGRVYT